MAEQFVDLSELRHIAESLPPIESSDYSEYELIPVGNYTSPSRLTQVRTPGGDGVLTFVLTFDTGFADVNGRTHGRSKYPLTKKISTRQFEQENRPGTTSTVAQYLRAVGLEPQKLTSPDDFIDAMEAAATLPVGVFIGRTNRKEKDESGQWTEVEIKTKEFLVSGSLKGGDAVYAAQITKDGVTYTGKAVVQGFNRLR